jgi:hypothetical protein
MRDDRKQIQLPQDWQLKMNSIATTFNHHSGWPKNFNHQSKRLNFFGLHPKIRASLKTFGICTKNFNRSIKSGHQSNNSKKLVVALKHFNHCLKNYVVKLGDWKNSVAIFGCHNWQLNFSSNAIELGNDQIFFNCSIDGHFGSNDLKYSGSSQKISLPKKLNISKKKSVTNYGDRKWATKIFQLPIVATESWWPNLIFQSSQHSQRPNDIIFITTNYFLGRLTSF